MQCVIKCVKAAGNTKVAGERSKKAQSTELLKSLAVSVSPKLKKITCITKQTIERSESGLAEQKALKKQRVYLTKSSVSL